MNAYRRIPAIAAASALLLAGCAGMGEYRMPAVPVADAYGDSDAPQRHASVVRAAESSAEATDIGTDAWWRGFGEEKLNRWVAQVLEANRDLAVAAIRLENARLQAGLADDNPALAFEISNGGEYRKPLDGGRGAVGRYAGSGIAIGYEVDLWRRLQGRRDAAHWDADATAEDLQALALSLAGDACGQYWALAVINQRIAAGEQSLAYIGKTLSMVRGQFAAGAVSRLEVREAEQALETQRAAQSDLLRQRQEIRTAMALLADGQPLPAADEPVNLAEATAPPIRPGAPAELLGRRPDLRAAELRLRAVFANGEALRADYYPRLSLTGNVDAGGSALADFLKNPLGSLAAGLALPLLNVKQMRLNNAISRNDYRIATQDFHTTLYRALGEVNDALSARDDLDTQLDASQKAYAAAAEAERLNEVRYRAGATPLRTWLDAQERRRTAEINLAQTRLGQLQNTVKLYQALGGGERG